MNHQQSIIGGTFESCKDPIVQILSREDWLQCLSRWHRSEDMWTSSAEGASPPELVGESRLATLLVQHGGFERHGDTLKPNSAGRELLYRVNELLHLRRLDASGDFPLAAWRESPGGAAVEIGCGTGHCLVLLGRMGFAPLYGYDLSPTALEMAKCLLEREERDARLYDKDATRLKEISDRSIALIYSRCTFHYFDLKSLAQSIGRVLMPGGQVVVEVKAPAYYSQLFKDLAAGRWRRAASYSRTLLRTLTYVVTGRQFFFRGKALEMGWQPRTIRYFAKLARLDVECIEYYHPSRSYRFRLRKTGSRDVALPKNKAVPNGISI